MSNDYWNQQQNGHNSTEHNGSPGSGSLLHGYRQQQRNEQEFPNYPPNSSMSSSSGSSPNSPMPQQGPPVQGQQPQSWPPAQSWPSGNRVQPQAQPPQEHGWVANTMQTVRRWSGRMSAVPSVDQNPLVLYRPPTTPMPLPKATRWKRSRSVRVAMLMKRRRTRWQQAQPKVGKIASIIMIVVLGVLVLSTFSASAYAYNYYQSQLPRLQGLANQQVEQTTRIYDRNGLLLYEAYNQNQGGGRRTPVEYQDIPQVLQDAQTSAEDPTFWTNSGVDPVGIVRAATQYLQTKSVQSGGSTITQQLIKNLTNDSAVTLNRKIPEAALAIGLTQQYSKAKILEMYFNLSAYGAQNLGVEAAAEDYFQLTQQCDKNFKCTPGIYYLNCNSAHELQCDPTHCATSKLYCSPLLGLARASLLAGMPQDPPTYDPTFGFIDQVTQQKYYLERQQYVLEQMLKYQVLVPGLGTITQDMVNQAEALTAKMQFPKYNHAYYHGDEHFVNWVISQMVALLGETFFTGGFNIRTTIDSNLEAYVEQAVHRHLDVSEQQYFGYGYGPLNTVNDVNDAAVVVMDAHTGEVLAMDGSANYNSQNIKVQGNFNAALAPRQPGSTIKPIVYAAAFQQGWYPGMVIPDYKTYFPNGSPNALNAYIPNDYQNQYSNSNTTVRTAIADSRNVPAVKASLFAGLGNVISLAQRFGITTLDPKKDSNVSFALGTSGIPLEQMVGAYQVFADQGTRVPPRNVLDIWDNYGHQLYHFDPTHPGGTQVISPQIAFLMTSILSDEVARKSEFWPDHDLSFWGPVGYSDSPNAGYPNVAAKTGTTSDFKDNWTIGYTSEAVVGVWAGNANDEPMQNVIGITGAAPIWHSVMTYISGMCDTSYDTIPCGKMDLVLKPHTFTAPSGVIQYCTSPANGLGTGSNCDWMLNGEQPGSAGYVGGTNTPTGTPTPTP